MTKVFLGWNYIGANTKAEAKILFDLQCKHTTEKSMYPFQAISLSLQYNSTLMWQQEAYRPQRGECYLLSRAGWGEGLGSTSYPVWRVEEGVPPPVWWEGGYPIMSGVPPVLFRGPGGGGTWTGWEPPFLVNTHRYTKTQNISEYQCSYCLNWMRISYTIPRY